MPTYDVFLSHAGADKPAVEILARKLRDEAGLRVFFDRWDLVPGRPWQEALEQALAASRTCAVFLGPQGLGPWHTAEMRVALGQRVEKEPKRVIPVLLPGADESAIPSFLAQRTWVDFRAGLDDEAAFSRLVAGIRGLAPGGDPQPSPKLEDSPGVTTAVLRRRSRLAYWGFMIVVLGALLATGVWLSLEPVVSRGRAVLKPAENPDAQKAGWSRIGGTVVDASHRGIAGARVSVRYYSNTVSATDKDGNFELWVNTVSKTRVRIHVVHEELGAKDTFCYTGSNSCSVVFGQP